MREIIDRKVVLSSVWSTARHTCAFFASADLLLVIAITLAPGLALRIAVAATVCGVLAALAPARRAARLDPAQAIRL